MAGFYLSESARLKALRNADWALSTVFDHAKHHGDADQLEEVAVAIEAVAVVAKLVLPVDMAGQFDGNAEGE